MWEISHESWQHWNSCIFSHFGLHDNRVFLYLTVLISKIFFWYPLISGGNQISELYSKSFLYLSEITVKVVFLQTKIVHWVLFWCYAPRLATMRNMSAYVCEHTKCMRNAYKIYAQCLLIVNKSRVTWKCVNIFLSDTFFFSQLLITQVPTLFASLDRQGQSTKTS